LLEVRRNFFSFRVVEEWKSISSTIKIASTVTGFKKQIQKTQSEHDGTNLNYEWSWRWNTCVGYT